MISPEMPNAAQTLACLRVCQVGVQVSPGGQSGVRGQEALEQIAAAIPPLDSIQYEGAAASQTQPSGRRKDRVLPSQVGLCCDLAFVMSQGCKKQPSLQAAMSQFLKGVQ